LLIRFSIHYQENADILIFQSYLYTVAWIIIAAIKFPGAYLLTFPN